MVKEGDKVTYINPMKKIHYEGIVEEKNNEEERIKIKVETVYSGKEVSFALVKDDSRVEKISKD